MSKVPRAISNIVEIVIKDNSQNNNGFLYSQFQIMFNRDDIENAHNPSIILNLINSGKKIFSFFKERKLTKYVEFDRESKYTNEPNTKGNIVKIKIWNTCFLFIFLKTLFRD